MNKKYEVRTDCEDFEVKEFNNQCGDCQTDGHYLCAGCKHIAPYEEMELSDNRIRYYEKQEKASIEAEMILSEEDEIEIEFQRCSDCDGHDACEDFGCAFQSGLGHLVNRTM